jgi:hypothetical protein
MLVSLSASYLGLRDDKHLDRSILLFSSAFAGYCRHTLHTQCLRDCASPFSQRVHTCAATAACNSRTLMPVQNKTIRKSHSTNQAVHPHYCSIYRNGKASTKSKYSFLPPAPFQIVALYCTLRSPRGPAPSRHHRLAESCRAVQ